MYEDGKLSEVLIYLGISLGLALDTFLIAESVASLTCLFGWWVCLPNSHLRAHSIQWSLRPLLEFGWEQWLARDISRAQLAGPS